MSADQHDALLLLRKHRDQLTRQQLRTLRGQILVGDVAGARRGLAKMQKSDHRRCNGDDRKHKSTMDIIAYPEGMRKWTKERSI